MNSALYGGSVTHIRMRPAQHRLRYGILMGLFDLEELPTLGRTLRLFAHNRAAPIAFHDSDHGDGSGDLRSWVEAELDRNGLQGPWGALRVLCMPRMFGYVFNPLSVFFCYTPDGRLSALLYEVNNTFGERHAYVLPTCGAGDEVRQSCAKAFRVSPFMPMGLSYRFRVTPPGAGAAIAISAEDDEGPLLKAGFSGKRYAFTDAALARALLAYPLMTLKVILGIHWEALKLWLRGVSMVPNASSTGSGRVASSR